MRLFYHEAKMFACKDIFAKPSIAQIVQGTRQLSRKGLRSKTFCDYYNINSRRSLASGAAARTQVPIYVSMFYQMSEGLLSKASVYIVRLFYYEAKMFACKDIFARPSIAQIVQGTRRLSRKGLRSKTFCAYYNTVLLFKQ